MTGLIKHPCCRVRNRVVRRNPDRELIRWSQEKKTINILLLGDIIFIRRARPLFSPSKPQFKVTNVTLKLRKACQPRLKDLTSPRKL